jgi:predicted neuraminidase
MIIFCITVGIVLTEGNSPQEFKISGKVIDQSGTPVSDATVKLNAADMTTATDKNGNFSIQSNTGTIASFGMEVAQPNFAFLSKGKIEIRTSKKTEVRIMGFNLRGKVIFKKVRFADAGIHLFSTPSLRHGVTLFKVTAGGRTAYLKTYFLGGIIQGGVQGESSPVFSGASTKQASADQPFKVKKSLVDKFNDKLSVSKAGYLTYQTWIYQAETRNMEIRLVKSDYPKLTKESVFTKKPTKMVHASTILELENGDLLCAWYGGPSEQSKDTKVYLSRKPYGGQWTPIQMIADGHGNVAWNPVLFQPRGGEVMCFYKSPDIQTGEVINSIDNGLTWSTWKPVGKGLTGPVANKPVQLDDGTIISPTSRQDPERIHVEISTDNGKTWTHSGDLSDFKQYPVIQPTIFVHSQTKLQMIMRRSYAKSAGITLATTWSHDAGQTWDSLLSLIPLPANDSKQDGLTLREGDKPHLLCYNHATRASSGMGSKGRGFLNLAASKNGKDWDAALIIEHSSGGRNSYPSIIQTRDGLLHITYSKNRGSIGHAIVNPTLLTEMVPMPDGKWPNDGPLSLKAYKEGKQ